MSTSTLSPMVRKCCKCARTERKGTWRHRFDPVGTVYTHTYCPACFVIAMHQVNQHAQVSASRAAISQAL